MNKVTVNGRFLCTKNYEKKDSAGNKTGEIVKQVLIFDGDGCVKISNYDGSRLDFGDVVSIDCNLYVNDYGTSFKAIE